MDVSFKVEMKMMPLLNKHYIKALFSFKCENLQNSCYEWFAKRHVGKCRKLLTGDGGKKLMIGSQCVIFIVEHVGIVHSCICSSCVGSYYTLSGFLQNRKVGNTENENMSMVSGN